MSKLGNGRFADKVVFVTGAGSGIGRATALTAARERSVVAADYPDKHNQTDNQQTVQSIEELGGTHSRSLRT